MVGRQRVWSGTATTAVAAMASATRPATASQGSASGIQEFRAHAEQAIEAFARTYGAKWPKAVAKITDDTEELPRELWARCDYRAHADGEQCCGLEPPSAPVTRVRHSHERVQQSRRRSRGGGGYEPGAVPPV